MFHFEKAIVVVGRGEDSVEVFTVCVGDENLSEGVATDELDDLFHTVGVELVENIVKQEDGAGFPILSQEGELRQLQGNQVRLVLSLRTDAADKVVAERHLQFIFMDTARSITEDDVALAIGLEAAGEIPLFELGNIMQIDRLRRAANLAVIIIEKRDERGDYAAARLENRLPVHHELHFEDIVERRIAVLRLEHRVALEQRLVILDKGVQIRRVLLGDNQIEETAAFVAPALDKFGVGRRDHYDRKEPDMFRELVVFLLVAAELLALAAADGAEDIFLAALVVIPALEDAQIFAVTQDLRIRRILAAFAKRKVIDGIEQVGFPHAVVSEEAIHLGRENRFCLRDILVIEYGQLL